MNTPEFQEVLRRTGRYETDGARRFSFADRLLGWSDAGYYLRLFRIVLAAHIAARRGRYDRKAWATSSHNTLKAVEGCGGHIVLSGLELSAGLNGPRVYVSNHMSMLETFLLPAILLSFGDVTTVVKEGLLDYPLFGVVLRATNPIRVTRRNPRDDLKTVLGQGEAFLRQGRSILVFPQSTRTPFFAPADFNTLGVKLARRAGVPVVPLALKTDFQRNGHWVKEFGRLDRSKTVWLRFGAPIAVADTGKAAHEAIVSFISENGRQWGGEVRVQPASDESEKA